MINDILQRLLAAETDEERSWIATESLLESLPVDVKSALWALAIPHWFDAEILAALCPELADRAEEIYRQLQTISCVEIFPERGHNVHELTRNQLLDRLWQNNPERFRDLSGRAAAYFAKGGRPETQIEWIYHLAIVAPVKGIDELKNLVQRWNNNFLIVELESLFNNLQEQVKFNPDLSSIVESLLNYSDKNIDTVESESDGLSAKSNNSQIKEINIPSEALISSRVSNKREAREQAYSIITSFMRSIYGVGALGQVIVPAAISLTPIGLEFFSLAIIKQIGYIYNVSVDESRAKEIYDTVIAPLIKREFFLYPFANAAITFLPMLQFSIESIIFAKLEPRFIELLTAYFNECSDLPE